MGRLILVGGGARSGKSSLALEQALTFADTRVFVATAQAFDDEMRARIARHKAERIGTFETVESPQELSNTIRLLADRPAPPSVVLVDCLTLWVSNRLLSDATDEMVLTELDATIAACADAPFDTIVVTNEVGLGIVPVPALGRRFRDVVGWCHQRLAAAADDVYFAVLGMRLRLKPGPVTAV